MYDLKDSVKLNPTLLPNLYCIRNNHYIFKFFKNRLN